MRRCRGCWLSAGGLVLAALLGLALFAWGGGRFLVAEDGPAAADAIVILGGEAGGFSRTQHGVALYDAGYAPRVVFSGGRMVDFGVACSSAQISLEAAQGLGLPAAAVVVAPEAQSTYDEALNLAALAAEEGWGSLLVVSDPFHTRRAGRTFRALLPGVEVRMCAAPNPFQDPARWWATEQGLVIVPNEYLKLLFYWIQHGVAPF